MTEIFDVHGAELDLGYMNIRDAADGPEAEMRGIIHDMWQVYRPYSDPDYCSGFAQDVNGRFWEMYLGCTLLEAGYSLLPTSERNADGGQPDLCVVEAGRRIWIEAIAPTRGDEGPDQVPELQFEEGVGVQPVPMRQARLRLTSAFWTKFLKFRDYLEQGIVSPGDRLIIAISGSRFAHQIFDDPPLPTTSLFPAGDEFITINRETGEVVAQGYQHEPEIEREDGPIARTAFLQEGFSLISGVLWSRIGLGNLSRLQRPLTMVHNPLAERPMDQGWGPWDKEYVARETEHEWVIDNIRA